MDANQNLTTNITMNKTEPSSNKTKEPGKDSTSISQNISKKEQYVFYDQMDDTNKKAMDVWQTKGLDAAIKHMFTDQESGRTLSYGEMRARYG
jgi:hypothetical protein